MNLDHRGHTSALRRLRAARPSAVAVILAFSTLAPRSAFGQVTVEPDPRYTAVAQELERTIRRELVDKQIPAISIALVDGGRIVWARGFGYATLRDSVPASAETVHRVGSVSKLFTDIAVMQLVEHGTLDLDAPVTRYLPDFQPQNNSGRSITLRQLMSHRAGLLREPPRGNYFDPSAPGLAETVRSINGRPLIYTPEQKTKYSNAGIAVVGRVVEAVAGEAFAPYLQRTLLDPLGMPNSAFEPSPRIEAKLADASMWTIDGREFAAPRFELGMSPAGSMYSTVLDLGRFLSVLFNKGRTADGRQIVRAETLEQMWTPQFAPAGTRAGAGLGFFVGELAGHRIVSHGGAIYGFATQLSAMPDEQLGVVVVATRDIANPVTSRIATSALELMLRARARQPLLATSASAALTPGLAGRLEGRYQGNGAVVELHARGDRLFLDRTGGTARAELRRWAGDTLIVDDAVDFGTRVLPIANGIVVGRDTLRRADLDSAPPAPRAAWQSLIGEYGWDHNTLYILEKEGRLTALIEWFFEYPLEPVAPDTFRFPAYGLYDNELLVFRRDASGRVTSVEAASVEFTRRLLDIENGRTFRITPQQPVERLRSIALAAKPPVERGNFRDPDLVDLRSLDPTIRYDIRYAGTNNFMGAAFYTEQKAFLQRPAAEAVLRAHRKLKERGYGLLIHDAYRPWYVTKMFWDATPDAQRDFVADPAGGSRHNRGAAVDLTLYDLKTGEPVEMVGGYDEFSERSYPDYPGGTTRQRWLRELLRDAMEAEGFTVYDYEWWHFDYRDWRSYPIQNLTFDQIR